MLPTRPPGRTSPLLLIEVARLEEDVVEGMHARNEPMLAKVFAYIEEHDVEPISLEDVVTTVNLSPT